MTNKNKETALRRMRRRRGMSMTALALMAGTEPAMLSLIERGKRPSRRTAERLAGALGLDPLIIWPEFESFRRY